MSSNCGFKLIYYDVCGSRSFIFTIVLYSLYEHTANYYSICRYWGWGILFVILDNTDIKHLCRYVLIHIYIGVFLELIIRSGIASYGLACIPLLIGYTKLIFRVVVKNYSCKNMVLFDFTHLLSMKMCIIVVLMFTSLSSINLT